MTALERDLLGKLGFWKDTRTTYRVADLAESLGTTTPRAQGALARLRVRGMVAYFEGHPGKWSITQRGRRELTA